MRKINESEIINKTAKETGLDKSVIKEVISSYWKIILASLKEGCVVNLLGKGKLYLKMRKGGIVHIPVGSTSKLADYPVLRFQVSKIFSKQLKEDYEKGDIQISDE